MFRKDMKCRRFVFPTISLPHVHALRLYPTSKFRLLSTGVLRRDGYRNDTFRMKILSSTDQERQITYFISARAREREGEKERERERERERVGGGGIEHEHAKGHADQPIKHTQGYGQVHMSCVGSLEYVHLFNRPLCRAFLSSFDRVRQLPQVRDLVI